MAIAGRILMMPKGNWTEDVTYEPLDLVFYENATWLCKKTARNITPAQGDYWQVYSLTAIVNSLDETDVGFCLDATQGRELALRIKEVKTSAAGTAGRLSIAETRLSTVAGDLTALESRVTAIEDALETGGYVKTEDLLEATYPVGALYMSTSDTSPADIFGGEWERLEDRFLLAAGETYAAGATGGAAEITLAVENLPSHTHTLSLNASAAGTTGAGGAHSHSLHLYRADNEMPASHYGLADGGAFDGRPLIDTGSVWRSTTKAVDAHTHTIPAHTHTGSIGNTGDGQAVSTLPPYLAVYVWQRTA